ncbi:MAG: AraC family transcriptional regulator ligand-binding domain-containing protein [Pseudomonadota bacterium]|nr:MAG: AraC family transcriptional regulator ligand-binding domain-containing protein [Pseudomonadota bacterium]
MEPTTIASWAVVIWRALDARGVDPRSVFQRAGLEATHLPDPNARYPISAMTRAWEGAVAATGDPCFGLEAARYLHPTTFHALGYAWLASPTLREGFNRLLRFTRLVSTGLKITSVAADGEFEIQLGTMKNLVPTTAASDAGMAAIVMLCRASCGDGFHPKQVRLKRPPPPCVERFNDFFQAPIEYRAVDNALVFDAVAIDKLLPTANAALARASDQVILEYLAHLDRADVPTQVKAKLVELLPSGRVAAKQVAAALHLSVRSMQRKLGESGTSFADLLEETRRELAYQYLGNSQMSVSEITYLLGFADPANFTRAFRRWSGTSPSQYRLPPRR